MVQNGKRGFEFYVGGGLGTVPQQAKLLSEFVAEEELLPLSLAIGRVFAKYGEKKNRNTARLKFLIIKIGFDEFKRRLRRNAQRSSPIHAGPSISNICPKPTSSRCTPAEFLQIKNSARRRVSEVVRLECIWTASAGLRDGNNLPAARRHHLGSVTRLGRHRPQVHAGNDPNDR